MKQYLLPLFLGLSLVCNSYAGGLKLDDVTLSPDQQKLLQSLEAKLGDKPLEIPDGGKVSALNGTATITGADGASRSLAVGDLLKNGEVLVTGAETTAEVVMPDLTVVNVSANSEFKLKDYYFNANDAKTDKGDFELLKGTVDFKSGVLNKRNEGKIAFHTAYGTLGARGTSGTLSVDGGKLMVITRDGSINLTRTVNGQTVTTTVPFKRGDVVSVDAQGNVNIVANVSTRTVLGRQDTAAKAVEEAMNLIGANSDLVETMMQVAARDNPNDVESMTRAALTARPQMQDAISQAALDGAGPSALDAIQRARSSNNMPPMAPRTSPPPQSQNPPNMGVAAPLRPIGNAPSGGGGGSLITVSPGAN